MYWLSHPSSNIRMTTFSVDAGVLGFNVMVADTVTAEARRSIMSRMPIWRFIILYSPACFLSLSLPFLAPTWYAVVGCCVLLINHFC